MATFTGSTSPKTSILAKPLVLPAFIGATLAAFATAGVVYLLGNHRSDLIAAHESHVPAASVDEYAEMQARLVTLSAQTQKQAERIEKIEKCLVEVSLGFNDLLKALEQRDETSKRFIADVAWLLKRDIDTSIAMQELAVTLAQINICTSSIELALGLDSEEMTAHSNEISRCVFHSIETFKTFQSQWMNHGQRRDAADFSIHPATPTPLKWSIGD